MFLLNKFYKELRLTRSMSKIGQIAKDAYIGLIGNRVNLAGVGLFLGGFGFYSSWGNGELFQDHANVVLGAACQISGVIANICTHFGEETIEQYHRAKEDFERYGKLSEKYLENILSNDYYCVRQGLYLAYKGKGHKEEFRKAEKKYSEKGFRIPNF